MLTVKHQSRILYKYYIKKFFKSQIYGAAGGTWTHTVYWAKVFKTFVSAHSTTAAYIPQDLTLLASSLNNKHYKILL